MDEKKAVLDDKGLIQHYPKSNVKKDLGEKVDKGRPVKRPL